MEIIDTQHIRPSNIPAWANAVFSPLNWAETDGVCPRPGNCALLGIDPSGLTLCQQTHGAEVAIVTAANVGAGSGSDAGRIPMADAMVTDARGASLCILTADCVPILLCDKRLRVVAAIHSGWRGTASDIVSATVAAMRSTYGCDPADIAAAIGPHIQRESYEVSQDVAEAIGWQFAKHATGRPILMDLGAAVRAQLEACGIRDIEACGVDTAESGNPWPSWRREKSARRLASIIAVPE